MELVLVVLRDWGLAVLVALLVERLIVRVLYYRYAHNKLRDVRASLATLHQRYIQLDQAAYEVQKLSDAQQQELEMYRNGSPYRLPGVRPAPLDSDDVLARLLATEPRLNVTSPPIHAIDPAYYDALEREDAALFSYIKSRKDK